MARAQKHSTAPRFSKLRPTSSKANAKGYQKRQSRKAQLLGNRTRDADPDVYEFEQTKSKRARANVRLELGREEAEEYGFGGGGDEDVDGSDDEVGRKAQTLKARLVGEGGDDEQVDSGEDEEIDSDEAFEESDDDRFAGFDFSTKKKPVKRKDKPSKPQVTFADVDLNEDDESEASEPSANDREDAMDEDDEDEEEGDPEDFIDILDVLDGRGEALDENDADPKPPRPSQKSAQETSERSADEQSSRDSDGDEEVEDDEEEEKEDAIQLSADEDAGPDEGDALDELSTFITSLETKKRRAEDSAPADSNSQKPRKRRLIQERTEAGTENPFAANVASSSKLKLDDLLAPLASQTSARPETLQSLRKSAKTLASSSGALSAPLPQRTQERLDREAAYEQTRGEVDKWNDTMKRIKEAEHLSFPLQAQPTGKVSSLELTAKFKPTTKMESSIDALLKSAQLRDEDINQTESLKMNHLSPEEVAARRAEVRRTRELLFRAEAKARRVAKIKSKAYRRIRKRQRATAGADGDEQDADEDDQEKRMKAEVDRARERATLKHKSMGKWARAMKDRGELGADQRRDVEEMLERGERLRRRIRGEDSGQSGSESDDDDDREDDDEEVIKARAFEELAELRKRDTPEEVEQGKGVFGMKFMKDAAARQQRDVDGTMDDFVREMGGEPDADGDSDDVPESPDVSQHGAAVQRTGGRVAFQPGPNTQQLQPQASTKSIPSDTSSVTLRSTDLPSASPPAETTPKSTSRPKAISRAAVVEENPWLVPRADDALKAPSKKNEVAISKTSAGAEKSKNKLKKEAQKREEAKEVAREDAVVEISADDALKVAAPSTQKAGKTSKTKQKKAVELSAQNDADSDVNSELEEQEKALEERPGKAKLKAFQQRDLVARAFAGDNVVQSFEEAKRREIAQDAPREVDTTLPGWGSWGGAGTKREPPKPHLIKKIAGVEPASRADHGKAHVIISEKRDKKAAKYLVKDLPHPYTSAAQFARSMETPLGAEWNTRVGFQRGTMPRVVKKPGVLINPLEKKT